MEKTLTITYKELAHFNELGPELTEYVNKTYQAAEKAYAPYSNFQVGAFIEFQDGSYLLGNNQENIAYPSGLCAERVALFYAGATYPDKKVKRLIVVANGELIGKDDCLSPCGSCRQVIAETERRQQEEIEIFLVSASGKTFVFSSIKDLLIFPFGI